MKQDDGDEDKIIAVSAFEKEVQQVGANSAVVYDPNGVRIGDYRKTNLFETDMTWAKPGM